ncbi:MAG: iron ABC transporter permease [Coriobacteriia bacterium]|nr:iron ABC transporter permease [Coriobacteriia bacterium]
MSRTGSRGTDTGCSSQSTEAEVIRTAEPRTRSATVRWLGAVAIIALPAIMIPAIMVGPMRIPVATVIEILLGHLPFVKSLVTPSWSVEQEIVVMSLRLPRVLLAFLVGGSLAVVGAAMQGLFRNPLAEPYTLGISAGALCGVALAMVAGVGVGVFGYFTIQGMAFAGAMGAILVVYSIARTGSKVRSETLLLAGIAVGFLLQAVVSFLKYMAPAEVTKDLVVWIMGSFSAAGWTDLKIMALPAILGAGGVMLFSKELNALYFGEEAAAHLGIEIQLVKLAILVLSAIATAASVAVSGIIGFVGLVVPHLLRMVLGADHRILLPACALAGGLYLVVIDAVIRVITNPIEMPIGIITSLVGCPYFIYLLRKKKTFSWWGE